MRPRTMCSRSPRLLGAAIALAAAGCSGGDPTLPNVEILPEMVDSVPFDAFAANPSTPDGKTLMAPPRGALPRGFSPLHYGPGPEEAARAGRELQNPLPDAKETTARGQVLFKRFCTPCHGASGQGDGPVVPPFPAPPPLSADHAKKMPDGQVFHVIGFGQGLMPAHGAQIAQRDRWAIVRFVRSLQGSAQGAAGGEQ